MDKQFEIATNGWKDTLNEIFFGSKDSKEALSDKEITEDQQFNLGFYSREMGTFIFGEVDYLGYKDPQDGYKDSDTPGYIFLQMIKSDIEPLYSKFPNLKDLTEKKIKAVKKVVREIQQIK